MPWEPLDDEQWDESFLNSSTEEEEPVTVYSGDEQEDFNTPPPVQIKSYKEAVEYLEDNQIFLEDRGCFEPASINAVPSIRVIDHVLKKVHIPTFLYIFHEMFFITCLYAFFLLLYTTNFS